MNLFDYDDYKRFVNAWVEAQPRRGHGQYKRIAETLNASSTIVSQIFRGDRDLSLEQAGDLVEFFSLTEIETEYFLALVSLSRAGSKKLHQLLHRRVAALKKQSRDLKARIPHEATLSAEARSTFYSHWYYSGIRNLAATPQHSTAEEISRRLELPRGLVLEVIEFLVRHGLLIHEKSGKLAIGPKRTHLEATSPLAARHHMNWRLKAFERYPRLSEEELAYTSPMSLSLETASEIRQLLVSAIQSANAKMKDSPSQEVYCLNLDWLRY